MIDSTNINSDGIFTAKKIIDIHVLLMYYEGSNTESVLSYEGEVIEAGLLPTVRDVQEITFFGEVRPKKNSKEIAHRWGRKAGRRKLIPFITTSKVFKKWHAEQVDLLRPTVYAMKPPYIMECRVYRNSLKKADLSNKLDSICDILVDLGVIEDDNDFVLQAPLPRLMGVDRENPRTEVTIYSLQPTPFFNAYQMMLGSDEAKAALKAEAAARGITQGALRKELWDILSHVENLEPVHRLNAN